VSAREVQITERGGVSCLIAVGPHRLVADERAPVGENTGPDLFELVLASLGACTSATLRM
jgi:putative redox protein